MTLTEQLKIDEGYRQHPYKDTTDKLTVGYGRNLEDVGISPEEAEMLLNNDIDIAKATLFAYHPIVKTLDQPRQDCLINMTFNMGIIRLSSFKKMWAAIASKDYSTAAEEMLNSLWAKQVGARASRLANVMRG